MLLQRKAGKMRKDLAVLEAEYEALRGAASRAARRWPVAALPADVPTPRRRGSGGGGGGGGAGGCSWDCG